MTPLKQMRLSRLLFAGLFLLAAATSEACSVCAVGKEEARGAYYATTALLSFLPLVMIGGVVYFLFKHSKK